MTKKRKNSTVTANQEKYIRANWRRMTHNEMAKNLGITLSKVTSHMIMWGLIKTYKRSGLPPLKTNRKGLFDVDAYYLQAVI